MTHAVDRELDEHPRPGRSGVRLWLRRLVVLALVLACTRIIINLVGQIDWDAVWHAIAHLHAWQLALLIGLVIVRQVLNALPLVYFIPGLSVFRATASDQGATLMSMVAPPTTDSVFRIVVLRSWGIDVDRAAAGGTSNILVFYMARWISPLLGLLLLLSIRFDGTYALVAAGSLLIAVAIFVGGLLVTKSPTLAERLGRMAGRVAHRVRRSVDPERWAAAVRSFQGHIADRWRRGVTLSLPTLVGKLFVDATICLLSIRFVGVGSDQLSTVEILAAFLVAFPLTLFPFHGIGILDATLVAMLTAVGGVELEAEIVAGLVTYRVMTLGVPALLGSAFMLSWRYTLRAADGPPRAEP
jgi:putative heme transporter